MSDQIKVSVPTLQRHNFTRGRELQGYLLYNKHTRKALHALVLCTLWLIMTVQLHKTFC